MEDGGGAQGGGRGGGCNEGSRPTPNQFLGFRHPSFHLSPSCTTRKRREIPTAGAASSRVTVRGRRRGKEGGGDDVAFMSVVVLAEGRRRKEGRGRMPAPVAAMAGALLWQHAVAVADAVAAAIEGEGEKLRNEAVGDGGRSLVVLATAAADVGA